MPEFFNLNTPHGPHTGSDRRHEGHTQEYQQGGGAVPLAPPRNMLPVDLIGGPATKIMDVSKDLLSVSDMKEELKDNKIFRFEKVVDKDRLDDHGRPKLHGWEQAIRTEDRSISKKAATEKIRELNYRTKDVLDKKSSLTPPLKRQLDRTLEELMSQEPDLANFHWLLVQIDHQLRPIEPYYYISSTHQHGRGHRHSTYHLTSKRKSHSRSRSSSSRHSKRRVYERLSLTAYFQRAPRPGVNIPRLWEEKRRATSVKQHSNNNNPITTKIKTKTSGQHNNNPIRTNARHNNLTKLRPSAQCNNNNKPIITSFKISGRYNNPIITNLRRSIMEAEGKVHRRVSINSHSRTGQ
ncbi:hypothetical protein NUW58_g5670 [Xylaria curta]|uniref:Uncharacterized protein n=1 Tax=Xylaria curta TaxID=42375 RepID=A0ACC1P0N4_9PEZI|nr:hypothetical protein NUW58_g5670 [Xylaria curta]